MWTKARIYEKVGCLDEGCDVWESHQFGQRLMVFDGIIVKRLDVDYGYKYSMSFGQRLMRFDGIIVECLDVDYGYRYSFSFGWILMWLMVS